MKKHVSLILALLMLLTPLAAMEPITVSNLPAWIPNDTAIRDYMVVIFNAAIEMANIKQSPYVIMAVRQEGEWVYATVRRASLLQEIKIGRFENISSVEIRDGVLYTKYAPKRQSWDWFSAGMGALGGGLLTLMLIQAFKN